MQNPHKRDELWRCLRHQFHQGEEETWQIWAKIQFCCRELHWRVRTWRNREPWKGGNSIGVERGDDLIGCKLLLKKKEGKNKHTQLKFVYNVWNTYGHATAWPYYFNYKTWAIYIQIVKKKKRDHLLQILFKFYLTS